ncbi:phage head spike fiber domain-containing protein [Aeromonas veronii]
MTTTAAGDAAVARLNNATEAFEKIITGASNQVVDVPGYGNQPTLAGRVDQRLDETTATAAAEANRSRDEADRATTQANAAANSVTQATAEYNKAKTQADRAQSEADRAAQITGLETVADAIGLAALPLPDVWAPLSDSLRLITGYGRDVMVGSDVVARMVNFSRNSTATYIGKDGQLKTAAANEPRFEKEGLLIEGQSTNLVPFSDNFSSYNSKPTVTTPESDGFTVFDLDQAAFIGSASALTVGAMYTVSALIDVSGPCVMRIGFAGQNRDIPISSAMRGVISFSANCAANTSALCRVGPLSRDAGVRVRVRYLQLEALPFASSYIPTAGAVVTRAADVCWIPMAGNSNNRMSFALTISGFKSVGASVNSRAIWYEPDPAGPYFGIRYRDGEILASHGLVATGTVYASGLSGLPAAVIAISPGVKSRAGQYTATQKADSTTLQISSGNLHIGSFRTTGQELWGHVRNLRIWHRALTEDQIKAVA